MIFLITYVSGQTCFRKNTRFSQNRYRQNPSSTKYGSYRKYNSGKILFLQNRFPNLLIMKMLCFRRNYFSLKCISYKMWSSKNMFPNKFSSSKIQIH